MPQRKMKPLTPSKEKVGQNLTKAFCATLPSEKDLLAVSKAFCATLPGEVDPVQVTKAFCATLPSSAEVEGKIKQTMRPVAKE